MWIIDAIRRVVNKLFPKASIKRSLGADIAVSSKMQDAIELWGRMYVDDPPWKNVDGTKTMNLPAAISHEFARLVTVECKMHVCGSPFADYINAEFQRDLPRQRLKEIVEKCCAKGGISMKPYVNGNHIEIDFTQADSFYPTKYDSNGRITGAVFADMKRIGDYQYTKLEVHEFNPDETITDENGNQRTTGVHHITNRAFRSEKIMAYTSNDDTTLYNARDSLHEEVPLNSVPGWEKIEKQAAVIDVDRPLFVYVKVPAANNIDTRSPLGCSVYARAVGAIRDADEQYTETKFEYEALQAAIDADEDLFKKDRQGNAVLPKGKERIFRSYDVASKNGAPFLKEFAPQFRDTSLFNGLNHYLRVVEWLCELSYGTLSDPSNVDRTAEEVKMSKQRSYSAVASMQSVWEDGLNDLVYIMSVYAQLYNLAGVQTGKYQLDLSWGDGVLEDVDKEYNRRWQQVLGGKLKPELFLAWYYGCSVEEAQAMMPSAPPALPEEE